MKSKKYVITVFDLDKGRRVILTETCWGIIAWIDWINIKRDPRYIFPNMAIRGV